MVKYLDLLINKQIIAIAPRYDGKYSSVIYTDQGDIYCEETVEELMNQFCLAFGSTLEGRKGATREYLKFRKNPPILISEQHRIVAFQVPDKYYKMEAMWIFDLNFNPYAIDSKTCEISYDVRNLKLSIPLTKSSLMNRKLKTYELLYKFAGVHKDSAA